jgi:hypothetical protein
MVKQSLMRPWQLDSKMRRSLVPVDIVCDSIGAILPLSVICIPSRQDVAGSRAKTWRPPTEPVHKVPDKFREAILAAVKKEGQGLGVARFPSFYSVKNACQRPTVGFVVLGALSLSRAKTRGIGFVSTEGLLAALPNFPSDIPPFLLCRCPNSHQYRKVSFDVLTSFS